VTLADICSFCGLHFRDCDCADPNACDECGWAVCQCERDDDPISYDDYIPAAPTDCRCCGKSMRHPTVREGGVVCGSCREWARRWTPRTSRGAARRRWMQAKCPGCGRRRVRCTCPEAPF
jgi:hypothetical protein